MNQFKQQMVVVKEDKDNKNKFSKTFGQEKMLD